MIPECITYLKERLIAAMGKDTVVLSTQKELSKFADSHVGAVLLEQDEVKRTDTRSGPGDQRQLYSRALTFSVVIGEYSFEAIEPCYCDFLSSLDRCFTMTDGHTVAIEVATVEWLSKDDNVLNAKVSAIIPITMTGGIYAPIRRKQIENINITTTRDG